jgi:hypothetical protein
MSTKQKIRALLMGIIFFIILVDSFAEEEFKEIAIKDINLFKESESVNQKKNTGFNFSNVEDQDNISTEKPKERAIQKLEQVKKETLKLGDSAKVKQIDLTIDNIKNIEPKNTSKDMQKFLDNTEKFQGSIEQIEKDIEKFEKENQVNVR